MSKSFGDERPGRKRRRRRRRRSGHVDPRRGEIEEAEEIDEALLSPEERAYLEARRTAEDKLGLYRECVKLGLPALVLTVLGLWWVAVIVLAVGGMKIGRRFYRLYVEPGMRERLVDEEVHKRVISNVRRERLELEDEHARDLEKLSASIAHEIRNPITAAKSLVQQMGEEPAGDDNVEYARVALSELERVERSISHLLRFARDEELRTQEVRMVDILDSALETFRDRSQRAGVEITRQFDCDGVMQGDAEKLRRVVINLVGNAIDALEDCGIEKPWVEVSMGENLAGSEVWVRIRDNGTGIDSETAQKIFSPFFTSKQGGTGLGLAITRKLVEAHDGQIELQSQEVSGADFLITFPKRMAGGSK